MLIPVAGEVHQPLNLRMKHIGYAPVNLPDTCALLIYRWMRLIYAVVAYPRSQGVCYSKFGDSRK